MKLLITHEIHSCQLGTEFYNPNGVIDYNALCNYRHQIKDILLVVRCKKVVAAEDSWLKIDGEGIKIGPIPEPDGVIGVVVLLPQIISRIIKYVELSDRYVVRLPGPTGMIVALVLILLRKGYGVEFVGHAAEGFVETRKYLHLKKFYGFLLNTINKFLVQRAQCVAYRSHYLRKLYPNKNSQREWVFSGAQLDDLTMGSLHQADFFKTAPFKIISVGRLGAEKGHMSLLHAFKIASERTEYPLQLHLVGDGNEIEPLKREAKRVGINDLVHFYGRVSRGPQLFDLLDNVQLFVLPSLTEGMPRSLIEAMAHGLPAFGSAVGGILELLEPDCLFAPGDSEAIAERILSVVNNPEKLVRLSQRNFEASKAHRPEVLNVAKEGFWNNVIEYCK